MNDVERRERINRLYFDSSEQLHSLSIQGFKCLDDVSLSLCELGSKMKQTFNPQRTDKEDKLQQLYRQSLMQLDKSQNEVSSTKVVQPKGQEKNDNYQNGSESLEFNKTKAMDLRNESHPQKYSVCLKKKKKRILHPDIEPDDDDDDDDGKECHCCDCSAKNVNANSKAFKGGIAREMFPRIPNNLLSKPIKLGTYKSLLNRKRKRHEEVEDYHRIAKLIRFNSFEAPSFFAPKDCSTPIPKKINGSFHHLPPKFKIPKSPFSMRNSRMIRNEKIEEYVVRPARILEIEDLSQSESDDALVVSPCESNLTLAIGCHSSVNKNTASDSQKIAEDDSLLNKTFVVSPKGDDPSPTVFSPSQSAVGQLDVTLLPSTLQMVPSPESPQSSKHSRLASTATSTSPKRLTRSSYKNQVALNSSLNSTDMSVCSPSKSRSRMEESTIFEKSMMLPPGTSTIQSSSGVKERAIELLDWSVIQDGSTIKLSGYVCSQVGKKYIKCKTNPVVFRHQASLVETSDGKFYTLVNRFVKSRSNIPGAHKYFQIGFPENWNEILKGLQKKSPCKLQAELTPGKISRDLEEMRISQKETKKHNKSLNRSFFELPEGKGTPESPLTRDDLRHTRKSGRIVVPPLAYWKNQRIMVDPRTNETTILEGSKNCLNTKVVCFMD